MHRFRSLARFDQLGVLRRSQSDGQNRIHAGIRIAAADLFQHVADHRHVCRTADEHDTGNIAPFQTGIFHRHFGCEFGRIDHGSGQLFEVVSRYVAGVVVPHRLPADRRLLGSAQTALRFFTADHQVLHRVGIETWVGSAGLLEIVGDKIHQRLVPVLSPSCRFPYVASSVSSLGEMRTTVTSNVPPPKS